jgi:ferrous iron transport protein B
MATMTPDATIDPVDTARPAVRLQRAALVGNPNAGKSALFNALTGARQKIANYPGVTVERKAGRLPLPTGETIELTDLPGSYGLNATSPDEEVTRRVILGELAGEAAPDVLIVVLDASNLEQHLVFAQEVIALGRPCVVALNMIDLAERDGLTLDPAALAQALGVPVIPTVAVRRRGLTELAEAIAEAHARVGNSPVHPRAHLDMAERRMEAHAIAGAAIISESAKHRLHSRLDQVLLHPWLGPVILFALLFVVFQAVFSWAKPFQDALQGVVDLIVGFVKAEMPAGLLRDFITDGALKGVGAVVVFLPQIIILFFFILSLEASGYMARAAFLMDRLMAGVGLSGRSFIPLLSSFACAVPGIMATRSITDPKDRLTTILIAPLMTCSARLPVYGVIIAAVIPNTPMGPGGIIGLQGLVLFALYVAGIVGAMVVALLLRGTITKGQASGFIMEMPKYQMPRARDLAGPVPARLDLPAPRGHDHLSGGGDPVAAAQLPAGRAGQGSGRCLFRGAYRQWAGGGGQAHRLQPRYRAGADPLDGGARGGGVLAGHDLCRFQRRRGQHRRGSVRAAQKELALPTALAFLAWFVFAPQCMSTIAVTRRETNGWKWPSFMLGYLFALAYVFAGITYWTALAFGL